MAKRHNRSSETGAATLIITVVLLLVSTLMLTFANRVGIFDIRTTVNEYRYKEAFSAAEAGLDFASKRFENAFRAQFSGSTPAQTEASITAILTAVQVPARTLTDGTLWNANSAQPSFTASIVRTGQAVNGIPVFQVTSTGFTADATGRAEISRQFSMINVFAGNSPEVPIIAAGAVGTGGNFNIVANPNGGGQGIPLSVWTGKSSSNINPSSSSATCYIEFYTGSQCGNPSGNTELLSKGTNNLSLGAYNIDYPDLLPNDPQFPDDLFTFMFRLERKDWQLKRAQAGNYNQVVRTCADVLAAGSNAGNRFPVWWVTDSCDISGGVIGSADKPVIVILDDVAARFSGGGAAATNLFGVMYMFNNPDRAGTPSASFTGGYTVRGSIVSDVGGNAMNGTYSVVHDPQVFRAFTSSGSSYSFSVVPGSWRDFPL